MAAARPVWSTWPAPTPIKSKLTALSLLQSAARWAQIDCVLGWCVVISPRLSSLRPKGPVAQDPESPFKTELTSFGDSVVI
ncbi:hypothetical protein N7541_011538 [Penicillium brevicompactum]|uniref:Uncharacterized protein n=1 Tax=Penicillium brevicompactum TaxID=5074 RepID=A0A9W9QSW8_PENBR|nr:hypothetical protein N7541_011538 [Penicillium brevicompactum]